MLYEEHAHIENLIVDEKTLDDFIEWLPPLEEHQAYLLQLMIRARGLKDKFGFRGTDHVLAFKAVHGYLRAETPSGAPFWRVRLKHEILRLGVLGARGVWEYANYEPGRDDKIRLLFRVPWQVIALYININPSDTLRAAQLTMNELTEMLVSMARSSGIDSFRTFFRRPDTRYYVNLARSTRRRFHSIDCDTRELFELVAELFHETFGYVPARIITQRGGHVLVNLEELERRGAIRKYYGRLDESVSTLLARYRKRRDERTREELMRAVHDARIPFFHRMRLLSELYVDGKGARLVELKKQALEPVPGAMYKGSVVVRFYREEF